MEPHRDAVLWIDAQEPDNATVSNTTAVSNSSTAFPFFNITDIVANATYNATNFTTQILEQIVTTVLPTEPPRHTRYCQENRIGCITTNGVCLELNLGGTVTQKCECFCGFFGSRCALMDAPKYYQECLKHSGQKAEATKSSQNPTGLDPVHVILGVTFSLVLLLLLFWFIYWKMCKYRYRIRQLKHQLSLYQTDDRSYVQTRRPPGTYWHNLAFQPDEDTESPFQSVYPDRGSLQHSSSTQTLSLNDWHCHPTQYGPADS